MLRATAAHSLRALGEPLLAEAVQTETDPRIRNLIRTFMDSITKTTQSEWKRNSRGKRTSS